MKIAFANDHAALTMREPLLKYLEKGGHEILDVGAKTEESVDYPDFAKAACRAVQDNKADLAILMCGTG
ncbi:MAG: RpiB/LacA/LacB family sugar-phosphate isomerase, partial [Candidatus Sumerlaeota bacterium]